MTTNEKLTSEETRKHIYHVQCFLLQIVEAILFRIKEHDQSKLNSPEIEIFTKYTDRLKNSDYGSKEYEAILKNMNVALDHHYSNNRHHPEHFSNGINDMNLIDIIEMLCDWKAAILRHGNMNIDKSLEVNQHRFQISDQLMKIIRNTIPLIDFIT